MATKLTNDKKEDKDDIPNKQREKYVSTGLTAASQIIGAMGARTQANAIISSKARNIKDSRARSAEIIRRAELQKTEMELGTKRGKGTAQASLAGSGFVVGGETSDNINVDYELQLLTDIDALDQETNYELMLEAANRRELEIAQAEAKKGRRGNTLGGILGTAGSIVGGIYGGAGGAAAGGAVGSAAGQYIGSR